ncbi:dienelactone hydrolase family protein [Paraliomyxa miuraensis]|nr:dienelactone hydrolase family protein [Paraliomyxa miuraensis]
MAALAVLGLDPGHGRAAIAATLESSLAHDELVTGGVDFEATLPMVVVLHGRGGGAGRLRTVLRSLDVPARVVMPWGSVRLGDGRPAWFGPRADGPAQDAVAGAVGEATDDLGALLQRIQDRRPTCGKAIVVGWSQGGVLAFSLALEHPELLSRAIAVAGTVPESLMPHTLEPHAPIIALHGQQDARVSYQHTRNVVQRLEALGYTVELHGYRHGGHEPDAAMLREVRRLVTTEVRRAQAQCSRSRR